LKITQVEAIPLQIPKTQGLWHWGWEGNKISGKKDLVIVKIHCSDGTVGLGDTEPSTRSESIGTVVELINNELGPRLVDKNPLQGIQKFHDILNQVGTHNDWLFPLSKHALVSALFDIKGKILNVPVYELLGGAYAKEVPCMPRAYVWYGPTEEDVREFNHTHEEIRRKIEADRKGGFKGWGYAIKVGAGGLTEEFDLETMRITREVIGNNEEVIYADANSAWDVKTAIRRIRRLEKYGPLAIEDPTYAWDVDGHATIRAAVESKVMTDVNVWNPFEAKLYIEKQAADIFILYPSQCGGIDMMKFMADWAEVYGMDVATADTATGIGQAACLHSVASTRSMFKNPMCQINGPMELADDIIKGGLMKYVNGRLKVPEGPGLGVELDDNKVEKYKISYKK
jgi:L-alanine-DL-glutamate epimerase-like enolase superfamily enzyme